MREDVAGGTGARDLLARVQAMIGDELRDVEEIYARELASWHPYVTDVLSHIGSYRGKRLRPMLVLLSARASGEVEHDHKVLAAVVEMIHTATLVHDDVLDEASTRRHVATVNARWNNETSVLLGDYLFTHAFHLASSLESTLACRLIGRATNLVCEGELAQIHERGNLDLTEEQYLDIIEGKTAELCALCCFLGGHFGGAPKPVVESLENYGRSLGIAFQIADDLLDVLGNEAETGKSLGTDFTKQKLTLPLIHLIANASPADGARIRELLMNPNEHTRAELYQFVSRSDCIHYAQSRGNEFAAAARSNLACLPDSPARQILEDLTEFVTHRTN